MPDKEKPLPEPPNRTSHGKRRFGQEDEWGTLLADRLAAAMAEGKLDDFVKQELSDNEYARNLATMMMGMTGMLPAGGGLSSSTAPERAEEASSAGPGTRDPMNPADVVPGDVRSAIQGGDVKGLMELLRREHQKRVPGPQSDAEEHAAISRPDDRPSIDKDVIDAMIQIASENGVTPDWIVLRAIKVYVQEYQKTGRL